MPRPARSCFALWLCLASLPSLATETRGDSTTRPPAWTLLVDLADVDGGSRMNQRHFRDSDSLANRCCLDLAWTPIRLGRSGTLGASTNLGRWSQTLADGTVVHVSDLLVALATTLEPHGSGPWIRLDAGVSVLLVDRITQGTDWGVGGSARVGWRFDAQSWALLAGGGWDARRYVHLDMPNIPALTLFAGVQL